MFTRTIALIAVILFLLSQTLFASDFRFSPRENSAHLINWRHWGPEVFEEAKAEKKLILLSLSAVWCHWCHVMDETTYSDSEVIELINKLFLPVRVDTDMRPDIDAMYNQGGWPSTAILTPDGNLLDGGTYIPPQQMLSLLSKTVDLYAGKRDEILNTIRKLKQKVPAADEVEEGPGIVDLGIIVRELKSSYDKLYGGFGTWRKFPNPEAIDLIFSYYLRGNDPALKMMITTTLDNMYQGELFDGTEGGFFRYATKPDWSEPHYEKMLAVNAGQIRNYAVSYQVFSRKADRRALEETTEYIEEALRDDNTGVFYGSQDADEEYYKARRRRALKRPFIDRTIYSDSNSQMITSLLYAYSATGKKRYLRESIKAAGFIIENLYSKEKGVHHYYLNGSRRLSGLLSDNALFGTALLDIYNLTGERRYIEIAQDIGKFILSNFYDSRDKRFRFSAETTGVAPVVTGRMLDFKTALANYHALILLLRLNYYEEDDKFTRMIDQIITSLKPYYKRYPTIASLYGTALTWQLKGPVGFVIVADSKKAGKFLSVLNKVYVPEKSVRVLSISDDREVIEKNGYLPENSIYICAGQVCLPPIMSAGKLKKKIKGIVTELLTGKLH